MKTVIAFDSIIGNTKKVAEHMAKELEANGHEVHMINLAERDASEYEGDLLIVGCPNRFRRVSSMAKRFIRGVDSAQWKGKRAIAFDTVLQMPQGLEVTEKQLASACKWSYEGAAPKMKRMPEKRGLICQDVWHFEVSGLKDPLVIGWEDKVRECIAKI
jgi:flavodoxin